MKKIWLLIIWVSGCIVQDGNVSENERLGKQMIPREEKSNNPIHEFKYGFFYKDQLYGRVWKNTDAIYELRIARIFEDSVSNTFVTIQYLLFEGLESITVSTGNIYSPTALVDPVDSLKILKRTIKRKISTLSKMRANLHFNYQIYQDCLNKYPLPSDGYGYLEIEELTSQSYRSFIFPDGNLKLCDLAIFEKLENNMKDLERVLSLDLINPPVYGLQIHN